jgi:hypothetical protein
MPTRRLEDVVGDFRRPPERAEQGVADGNAVAERQDAADGVEEQPLLRVHADAEELEAVAAIHQAGVLQAGRGEGV